MGPVKFRTYHEVTGDDASQLGAQVAGQRSRVAKRLEIVRRVVAVVSGKGGVGKSHVTAALALGAHRHGSAAVGVLDADLESPTVAGMLGAAGPVVATEDAVQPATGREGVKVFSTDLLLDEGRPLRWRDRASERFVWRGTLEASALREFLADVAWGSLDLLLVDLPPGGHRLEDLAELVPRLEVIGVTIPSEEARRSVLRCLTMARDRGLPILGVIENMSGYLCGGCGATGPLFEGNAGAELAAAFDVPLLARLPFRPGRHPDADARALAGVIPASAP
jgi:ATP-binding protein involved in chromosome partitioning